MPVLLELACGAPQEICSDQVSGRIEAVQDTPAGTGGRTMSKDVRKILGGTLTLATGWIFLGLVFWGFMLYTRNEWMMW
jgi:hypothetical protein